jgi:hypothetical protein
MAFEKNTVDFLKEYAIRYKKILYGFLGFIGFLVSKNLYNKYSFFMFNKNLEVLNQGINQNSLEDLNKFYNKYSSSLINHQSIFVLGYVYTNGITILYKKINEKYHHLIDNGQWMELYRALEASSMKDKKEILDHIKILEKIYQFTVKRIPYNCILNSRDVHYYGEILNVLILIHMTHRESKEKVTYFYHKACLHTSLYKTYTNSIYNYFLNPKNSLNMTIFSSKTKNNLLKKFLNF